MLHRPIRAIKFPDLTQLGIRTFETYTRNTLDLSIVPSVKQGAAAYIVNQAEGTVSYYMEGMGAPMGDVAAATTTDGATTYQVNAGPGGPFTSVSVDGLVTSLLVGTNGRNGCDHREKQFAHY